MSRAQICDNPFYVLELEPDCSRMEIERQGQKLLAMLEVGFSEAHEYATPFGPRERTRELVRASMAALRDPRRRLIAEMWARAGTESEAGAESGSGSVAESEGVRGRGWSGAMAAFGIGRSRR